MKPPCQTLLFKKDLKSLKSDFKACSAQITKEQAAGEVLVGEFFLGSTCPKALTDRDREGKNLGSRACWGMQSFSKGDKRRSSVSLATSTSFMPNRYNGDFGLRKDFHQIERPWSHSSVVI